MNTSFRLIIALMTALSVVMVSCNQSKKSDNSETTDDSAIKNFVINETYKTAQATFKCVGDTTFGADVTTYTERAVSIQWPEKLGDNDLKCLQDSLIANVLDLKSMPVDSAIMQYINHPIGYGDYTLERVDSMPVASNNVRVLSQEVSAHTVGFCERYIVYKIDAYDYQGGAHPNYASSFLTYDIKNNNVLDFDEIFTAGSEAMILDVIKATLCDMYYASSLNELKEKSGIFTNQIYVTHNLYITDANIVFHYNPYDIAPWAVGEIEVSIPEYNLDQYLTPAARELFGSMK